MRNRNTKVGFSTIDQNSSRGTSSNTSARSPSIWTMICVGGGAAP